MTDIKEMVKNGDAPSWVTEDSYKTLKKRLYKNETPRESYMRVATRAAEISGRHDLKDEWFQYLWDGIICLATPVHSNFGTGRGLPASCFKTSMYDNLTDKSGIYQTNNEVAEMSRVGGGVGVSLDRIRCKGSLIKGNGGVSGGVLLWMRMLDTTFDIVSQSTRRGAGVVCLNIEHGDWDEFIESRDNTGDPRRRVNELNLSTRIDDSFMEKLESGDKEARRKWEKLLQTRWETGESYIEFDGNVNKNLPKCYKDRNFKIDSTNLCSEILQYADDENSVVCVLSSLNLAKYGEYDFERAVELIHRLLDTVVTEFIEKSEKFAFLGKARNGAQKARALGIGVLGWHDLLIKKGYAFDTSMETMFLNTEIFKTMDRVTLETSKKLAEEYGEPEWLKGYGERNVFRTACAPTKSNAAVVSVEGEGISPVVAWAYSKEGAEGTIHVKSKHMENLLETYGKNDYKTWKSIIINRGSVQHLDFLSDNEKKIFLTAREIDQHSLVKQASSRQKFIDQGQSLNLFFPANASESYINSVHLTAYKLGLKTLYYLKSGPAVSGDFAIDCESCEG